MSDSTFTPPIRTIAVVRLERTLERYFAAADELACRSLIMRHAKGAEYREALAGFDVAYKAFLEERNSGAVDGGDSPSPSPPAGGVRVAPPETPPMAPAEAVTPAEATMIERSRNAEARERYADELERLAAEIRGS